ncbi:class A beta-lactamase-related serine hydrolase [Pseudoalteromonas sp. J010]|uniref:serine hydrolase domain-containing protein n=1 Tax=Pseudoalteromonas sp. J010 TaxID=998465 RepID=UPI000F649AB7|nr:serine hydrolase domain-containing protein [Pseudoalteromonas sp. J010]RRS08505.1 class A beta-lactamase-related serine hydrolase [Pseudoalteromonas sp. J010]
MEAKIVDGLFVLKVFVFTLAMSIFFSAQAQAQATKPHSVVDGNEISDVKRGRTNEDFEGLRTYVDDWVDKAMVQHNLPGVAVSIVKDGEVILLKGYGFANVASQTKVDPNTTLFRIGSITKTMTALAVMQLVEQGKLSLDTDINEYLSEFKIPDTFAPITIRALLSHRAGFEEADAGHLFVENPSQIISTEQYLATYMPKRVWPPGVNVSYSNYGFALLGYLVELQSGMDLATYMEQHIFSKLGMENTTLREPVNARAAFTAMKSDLQQQLAAGYFKDRKGNNTAKSFEFIGHAGGAGAVSTTANDMARYMSVLMNDNNLLVQPVTQKAMSYRLYDDRPLATGIAHGMFDGKLRGYKVRYHSGATHTFAANMVMFPEIQLGIFISTNVSGSGGHVVETLPTAILNKYYRNKPTNQTKVSRSSPPLQTNIYAQVLKQQVNQPNLEDYTGTFLSTRRSYTQLEKLAALDASVSVTIEEQQRLVMIVAGGKIKLKHLEGDTFQAESQNTPTFYFYRDDTGNIARFSASMWSGDYERVGFLESPLYFNLVLAIASLLSLLTLLLCIVRVRQGKRLVTFEKLACCSSTMIIVATVGFTLMNVGIVYDEYKFHINFPTIEVKILLSLVLAIVLTTFMKVIKLPLMVSMNNLHWLFKIHYVMCALSYLSVIHAFWVWNAVGFNYFS